MVRRTAVGRTMAAARTSGHQRRRWGHRGSGGEARGAQMVAGDGELAGEEVVAKGVLGPEAIAMGSGLKPVLDKEEATAEQVPGSNDDG
jgi:hypothetical protein